MRSRVWRKGVLEKEDFPLENVSDYLEQEDCLIWADLCMPDTEELDRLADELSLDPLAVEDALERHERPKVDRYPSHMFATTYAIYKDAQGNYHPAKVSAFLLPRALVTVRQPDFDIETVVASWDANRELLEFGPKALLYGLLDVVVDGHLDALQAIDDRVDEVEDMLFDDGTRSADVQRSTYQLRRHLTSMRKVVLPMREVADVLVRHTERTGELGERYRDLHDHVRRSADWTDSLRDTVTTVFETGLALADTRLNQIVRKLSAWAAIIAVPTAVTGFYGQNVPYPGYGHWSGFLVSCVITILLAGGAYFGFKRNGWL